MQISVSDSELKIIKDILKRHLSECQVWAFGSRVNGGAKPHSDLDLAVVSAKEISPITFGQLNEEFSESNLSFRVDIVDMNHVSQNFRQLIEKSYIIILTA